MIHTKQDYPKIKTTHPCQPPPEGISKKLSLNISDNHLLHMAFFLNEDINKIFALDDDEYLLKRAYSLSFFAEFAAGLFCISLLTLFYQPIPTKTKIYPSLNKSIFLRA
jgi:hypothetical protein